MSFFRKKSPKRLYLPAKSRWYTRPRRQAASSLRRPFQVPWKESLIRFIKNRLTLTLVGAGIFFLIFTAISAFYFSIRHFIILRENFNVDNTAIEQVLKPYAGKNLVFFPRHLILKAIQKQFPEFSSVEIEKDFPNTLKIKLQSYPLVANLRVYYVLPESLGSDPASAESPSSAVQNPLENQAVTEAIFDLTPGPPPSRPTPQPESKKEAVEQKGMLNAIGQAIFDQEENLEFITIVLQGLTQPVEDRALVIPPEKMDFIIESVQYFNNALSLPVTAIDYLPVAREIHLKTKKGFQVWLALDQDYQSQIEKLKAIYEPAELTKESLSYIDLRIREKVIYCSKGAACASR